MKKHKLGIALGGGGFRGFAHLGVLQALNEAGLYPDIISGTSAGSIVGALYSAGYTPLEIFDLMKDLKTTDLTKLHLPIDGLFGLENLSKSLKKALPKDCFSCLNIPLIVCIANLNTGKAEYIEEGEIIKVIEASCSIPIVFSPVKINGQYYVDGGLIDNMPVRPLVKKCEKIIGVNIFPTEIIEKVDNLYKIATRIFQISLDNSIAYNKRKCDIYIEPKEVSDYFMLESGHNDDMYEIGYKYGKEIDFNKMLKA